MRRSRRAYLPLVASLIILASAGLSYAAVVTVDVAAKTAASDVTILDTKGLKVIGNQAGIFVKNLTLDPQKFTLKVSGLTAENYDVYVNHAFVGPRPAKDFAAGVEYTIDGRIVDDGMMKCVTLARESIAIAKKKWDASADSEAKRACYTFGQAFDWCGSAVQRDQGWRSVSIILAPSGRMLDKMTWLTRDSDIDTARAVTRACWLLQQARARMYDNIKNESLRNEAVVAMTPVSFTARYSIKNGKRHIEAKLVNNCDLPISGGISMALPKGWKSTAKKLAFTDLKCGKSFGLSFDLVAPSKSAVAPESVPMAASIALAQDDFKASCKLAITAKAEPK